jgi:hypothetical protein
LKSAIWLIWKRTLGFEYTGAQVARPRPIIFHAVEFNPGDMMGFGVGMGSFMAGESRYEKNRMVEFTPCLKP